MNREEQLKELIRREFNRWDLTWDLNHLARVVELAEKIFRREDYPYVRTTTRKSNKRKYRGVDEVLGN